VVSEAVLSSTFTSTGRISIQKNSSVTIS